MGCKFFAKYAYKEACNLVRIGYGLRDTCGMFNTNPSKNGYKGIPATGNGGTLRYMCGIAGFTHLRSHGRKSVAQRIVHAISHRGPDQQGIYEGSEATLCAVRLKIIDLEGGDQPIVSDDGDTTIAFNGEIYNHLEIRAKLEELGHQFRSHCDIETILRAFLQWDTACFSKMRGMFAVALWTESQRRLVLVRDRMGIKPLYYYRSGEDLYFGSELKAIFEHPDVPRHLDPNALDAFLSVNYEIGRASCRERV